MKIFTPLLLFIHSFVFCQVKTIKNIKIDQANKVNINNGKGGIINIAGAKNVTIAKIVVTELKSKIFLKDFIIEKDTSGIFVTTLSFANPEKIESNNIDIEVKCGAPIIGVNWGYAEGMTISFGITEDNNFEKGEIKYKAAKLSANSTLILTIKSKTKILPTISGIDGKF